MEVIWKIMFFSVCIIGTCRMSSEPSTFVSNAKYLMCPATFSKGVTNIEYGTICHPLTYSWENKENAPDYINLKIQDLKTVGKPVHNEWINVAENLGNTVSGRLIRDGKDSKRRKFSYRDDVYPMFSVFISGKKNFPNKGYVHMVVRTEPENFAATMKVLRISKTSEEVSEKGLQQVLAVKNLFNQTDDVRREHSEFERRLKRLIKEKAYTEAETTEKVSRDMDLDVRNNTQYTVVRNSLTLAIEEHKKAEMDVTVSELASSMEFSHLRNPFTRK